MLGQGTQQLGFAPWMVFFNPVGTGNAAIFHELYATGLLIMADGRLLLICVGG